MFDNPSITMYSPQAHATLSVLLNGSAEKLGPIIEFINKQIASGEIGGKVELNITQALSIEELLRCEDGAPYNRDAERPRNTLRRYGIATYAQLSGKTADELLAMTNFGQKSLDYVNGCLSERGLPEII
jgi:DNA-directed RNA polymerase alpha subunit